MADRTVPHAIVVATAELGKGGAAWRVNGGGAAAARGGGDGVLRRRLGPSLSVGPLAAESTCV